MSVVLDASVLVAWLVDGGPDGQWAEEVVGGGGLIAPHLLPFEVANVLRRSVAAGSIGPETASLSHADLLDLGVTLVPYAMVAERAWDLRDNLTSYDASYVALAELLDIPFATLDQRIVRAPGVRCEFLTRAA